MKEKLRAVYEFFEDLIQGSMLMVLGIALTILEHLDERSYKRKLCEYYKKQTEEET